MAKYQKDWKERLAPVDLFLLRGLAGPTSANGRLIMLAMAFFGDEDGVYHGIIDFIAAAVGIPVEVAQAEVALLIEAGNVEELPAEGRKPFKVKAELYELLTGKRGEW